MKRVLLLAIVTTTLLGVVQSCYANQKEFEAGFIEGYKSILGDAVLVPIVPISPITPIGSTPYREGIKAGIAAAQRVRNQGMMGSSPRSSASSQTAFEAGFIEGYRSIKGNLAIVPLCPIAPITPIGSTPFREGIKAGIRAARGTF